MQSEQHDWRDEAACASTDPELFFPEKSDTQRLERAKAVCGRCAVQAACLEYALTTDQREGVWGGLSEGQRRALRRDAVRRRLR